VSRLPADALVTGAIARLAASRARLRAEFQPADSAAGARSTTPSADAGLARAALSLWWRHHPWRITAGLVGEALALLLAPEAKRHPVRMLALAALAGGLLAASRPWRWLARPALMTAWPVLLVGARQALAALAAGASLPPTDPMAGG
jgi:hypothetical protein